MTLEQKIRQEIERFRNAVYGEEVRESYADIAETVCVEAMQALDHAVEQGNLAESQGDYAKNQGDYAKNQGGYAAEQGSEAGRQAAYAKAEGDRVDNLCGSYTEIETACRNATDASVKQTRLCENATQRAVEAATGYSLLYDPVDGIRKTTQETVNNIWKEVTKMFGSPITADEYNALQLSVDDYNALHITASEYDTRGKAILNGRNGGE